MLLPRAIGAHLLKSLGLSQGSLASRSHSRKKLFDLKGKHPFLALLLLALLLWSLFDLFLFRHSRYSMAATFLRYKCVIGKSTCDLCRGTFRSSIQFYWNTMIVKCPGNSSNQCQSGFPREIPTTSVGPFARNKLGDLLHALSRSVLVPG